MRISHINQYFDKVLTTKIENPIPFETVHLSTSTFYSLCLFLCVALRHFSLQHCSKCNVLFPYEHFRLKAEMLMPNEMVKPGLTRISYMPT